VSSEEQLAGWWRSQAESEISMVVDKAIEYGARDLVLMGRELAAMAGREVTDQQAAELGCVMYLVGKMARVSAAWSEGRMPSDDTYLDIGVYVRMVQRIRQSGGWPS
jgi:type IV secretory pathway TrbD component